MFGIDVKRLSGRAFTAVDSICNVVIAVRLVKELGREPAGFCPLPTIWRFWRPVRAPISFGTTAGTAGKVSCLFKPLKDNSNKRVRNYSQSRN